VRIQIPFTEEKQFGVRKMAQAFLGLLLRPLLHPPHLGAKYLPQNSTEWYMKFRYANFLACTGNGM
jgi:hypothetical protein